VVFSNYLVCIIYVSIRGEIDDQTTIISVISFTIINAIEVNYYATLLEGEKKFGTS